MDTRELARLIMPDLRLAEPGALDRARELLAHGELPGFLLFGGSAEEVRELTATLDRECGRSLIYSADLERGAGQQFSGLSWLPPCMAVSATGRVELARRVGRLTAVEAASVGVRLVFAPVADVHTHPTNPIVGSRAYGADPALVARMAGAFCEGVLAGGGLPVAKHFPGHGSTEIDSHVELATAPEAEPGLFEQRHLAPFAELIARELTPALMSAHVSVPALDGSGLPATWSRTMLTELLREELGYGGVVLSDALLMGAMDAVGPGEAAWRSLMAGVDLLLAPRDLEQTLREMVAAPPAGAAERVADALARLGSLVPPEPTDEPTESAAALAADICRKSITLLDEAARFTPLDGAARVVLTGQQPDAERVACLLEALPGPVTLERTPLAELSPEGEADLVVFDSAIGAWKPTPFQPEDYLDRLAGRLRSGARLLMLDHPGPAETLAGAGPVLLSYGAHPEQQRAAAAVLRGEAEAPGQFPGTSAD